MLAVEEDVVIGVDDVSVVLEIEEVVIDEVEGGVDEVVVTEDVILVEVEVVDGVVVEPDCLLKTT
jgi:hypothetical protein